MVGGPPLVLNEKAVVSVIERTLRLISNVAGNVAALIDRGIECRLQEIRCLEALEEDYVGSALHACNAVSEGKDAILNTAKVCFERIEERERLGGRDKVRISAELDRVATLHPGQIVHHFSPVLLVHVGISA